MKVQTFIVRGDVPNDMIIGVNEVKPNTLLWGNVALSLNLHTACRSATQQRMGSWCSGIRFNGLRGVFGEMLDKMEHSVQL